MQLIKLYLISFLLTFHCSKIFSQTNNLEENERPNVIIFYSDDQGTLDAGCYGTKDIKTPHLDGLAAVGLKFTQAYSHTVCCPSRAALLTGRAPQRSGVNQWTSSNPLDLEGRVMDLSEITIAEHLKDYGYRTGLIGKWHLGATLDHGPLDQGFDEFFGFRGGFIDYYSHKFLHADWQKPQFHDLYRGKKEVFEDGRYFPDMQVEEANNFLERNQKSPFFLYLSFNLPHYPEQPDSIYVSQYKNLEWPRNSYAPMISTLDDRMGKVIKKIDELNLRENTIIIFMSDNGHSTEDYYNWGESYGGNGGGGYTGKWRGAKGSFLEGGIRVPAVISFPKLFTKGGSRNQIITNLDIFPTICEILGIPLPENKLDGKSIVDLMKSNNKPSPHKVLHWMWQDMWAIRKGNWKLIFNGKDTTGKYSENPEKSFEMPKYYLANLNDERPEEINYASKYPNLVRDLNELHKVWAKEVFMGSGDKDPTLFEYESVKSNKKMGSKKL